MTHATHSLTGDVLCKECGGIGIHSCVCTPDGVLDDKGHPINIGDEVIVTHINTDRGAQMLMHKGEVVGFGRTRVNVRFPSRGEPQPVGNECLRVIE